MFELIIDRPHPEKKENEIYYGNFKSDFESNMKFRFGVKKFEKFYGKEIQDNRKPVFINISEIKRTKKNYVYNGFLHVYDYHNNQYDTVEIIKNPNDYRGVFYWVSNLTLNIKETILIKPIRKNLDRSSIIKHQSFWDSILTTSNHKLFKTIGFIKDVSLKIGVLNTYDQDNICSSYLKANEFIINLLDKKFNSTFNKEEKEMCEYLINDKKGFINQLRSNI